jgi:hypothetical protein
MAFLSPVTLRGAHAALAPLSHGHLDGLVEAARDGELWRLWYTLVPKPEGMHAEIERRLALQARESMLPFTVLDADGRIAGTITQILADIFSTFPYLRVCYYRPLKIYSCSLKSGIKDFWWFCHLVTFCLGIS